MGSQYRGRSKPHSPRQGSSLMSRLSKRFRWLGINEGGSVLAAGVIVLGIFSVLFATGVRQEGSAQELDILTAHRRKALDVARGGMDKLLMEFNQNSRVSDCSTALIENDVENWQLAPAATQLDDNTVLLTSQATISGVSETVTVTMHRDESEGGNPFQNFLGGITIAARDDITGNCLLSLSSIGSPVYYGARRPSITYVGLPLLKKTEAQIDIPTIEDVDVAVRAQVASLSIAPANRVNTLPRRAEIAENTRVTPKSGTLKPSGNSLKVNAGKWLIVDGSLNMTAGLLQTFNLELYGNIVVLGGSVSMGGIGSSNVKGNGMIICLPSGSSGISIGQIGVVGLDALTLISTGNVSVGFMGTFDGGLLAYGKHVHVGGILGGLTLSTCCLVSDTNVDIDFFVGTLILRKGTEEGWKNQPLPKVVGSGSLGPYKIISWDEGNT